MAATAYASLVSLMNVLTRYQHPSCPVPFDQSQVQTLLDKVGSLVEFLESYYDSQTSATSRGSIHDLESKMTSVAQAAEDMIEYYYVNRILDGNGHLLCPGLQNSIEEMDQVIQDSMNIRVKRHKTEQQQEEHGKKLKDASVSRSRDKHIMVGFEDQLRCLMEKIKNHKISLEIISIVGMGGIGKTTLVRNAYNYTRRDSLFDVQAWGTISQNYAVKEIIIRLLDDIEVSTSEHMDDEQLGDLLYKSLCGRKYLIVLDDMWSFQAWDVIRRFFPDNSNGSRILLTTRVWSVAKKFSNSPYQMQFLDSAKSSILLSETIYGRAVFPSELKTLGNAIAESCKGLPLSIVVIGGLLKTSPARLEVWADVAKNVSSIVSTEDDGHSLEILSLSYNHLPVQLKPCFLYMTTFKEDEQIIISDLVKLWVAVGFLKPTNDKILEEIALEYLNDLIDRNLVMEGVRGSNREIESCNLHDSLREFCLREAQSKKFLCLYEEGKLNLPQMIDSKRHVAYVSSNYISYNLFPSTRPHARSLYVDYPNKSEQLASGCGLLRVLHIRYGFNFPVDPMQIDSLRHLVYDEGTAPSSLLPSLPSFWNMEILILTSPYGFEKLILPPEIWELPNIRFLNFKLDVQFPDPRGGQTVCVLHNLQTISTCSDFLCTDEVFRRIPNLKELRFCCEEVDESKLSNSFANLACLAKLEILSVSSSKTELCSVSMLENLTFSPNLRELQLSKTGIPWEYMTIIGSLPNLKVLKLEFNAFCGEEWDSNDDEFLGLIYLSIKCCDLGIWNAEDCHFPRLEYLNLDQLDLKIIPMGIGEAPSLELIELYTDHISAVMSAQHILVQRQNDGDDDLSIKGLYYGRSEEEKEKLEMWAKADKNFRIKFDYHPEEEEED